VTLQGKGFFTFNLQECEGGDPASILAAAQAAGLSHVIFKIADGTQPFGGEVTLSVVQALHDAGIAAWGWHLIHGANPMREAAIAIERARALGIDGYVIVAEDEYNRPGTSAAPRQFMSAVRAALKVPIALSSYRFPNFHPEFPWSGFLEFCDLHMPRIAWEQTHNTAAQIHESRRQSDALPNSRPFVPTAMLSTAFGWVPSVHEVNEFLNTARALGLPAVNFFNWDACRRASPQLWDAIAAFAWPLPVKESRPTPNPVHIPKKPAFAPPDAFLTRFLTAFNHRQAAQMGALYAPSAVQVKSDQILSSPADIQSSYAAFFKDLPAGTFLTVSQVQKAGDLLQFSWHAGLLSGETALVLEKEKIILDYTFMV
jgi:hypothetical protein